MQVEAHRARIQSCTGPWQHERSAPRSSSHGCGQIVDFRLVWVKNNICAHDVEWRIQPAHSGADGMKVRGAGDFRGSKMGPGPAYTQVDPGGAFGSGLQSRNSGCPRRLQQALQLSVSLQLEVVAVV